MKYTTNRTLVSLVLSLTLNACEFTPPVTEVESPTRFTAELEDFGYGTMKQAGSQLPVGERPLMVIRVQGPSGKFPHTWTNQEIEDRIFNRTTSINAYFERASDGIFQWKNAGIYGVWSLGQDYPEMYQTLEKALQLANQNGVDFAQFDTNGDLTVDTSELGLIVLDNYSHGLGGVRAIPCVPSNGGVNVCLWGADMGGHTSLSGLAHELAHQLGTIDVYGDSCLSLKGTLMSCPTGDTFSSLDPWHRMRLGWVEPQVVGLDGYRYTADSNTSPPFVGSARPEGYVAPSGWNGIQEPITDTPLESIAEGQGGCYRIDSSNSVGSRPLLLYSTARGAGEFFMIESRYRSSDNWLFEGLSRDIYIWQVRTNQQDNLYNIQSLQSEYGMDMTLFLYSQDGVRGNREPWTQEDGSIPLRWIDGRDSGLQLRVSDNKYDFAREAGYHWVEVGTAGQFPAPGPVSEARVETYSINVKGQMGLGDSLWFIEINGVKTPLEVLEKSCNEWILGRPEGLSTEELSAASLYRGEERVCETLPCSSH